MGRLHGRSWGFVAPAVFLVVLLGGWEAYVRLGGINDLLLPAPTQIADSLWTDRSLLASDLGATCIEVALGLALAVIIGAGVAVAMHLSERTRRTLLPLAIGSQALPFPVIAPLFVFILGFGFAPKLLIVVLVCFFPVTITLYDGLRNADPDARRVLDSLGATRWQRLVLLEARAALPSAFSGLKIAAAVAVIGAVFAEWAGTIHGGLGKTILTAGSSLDTPRAFAATVLLFVLAIALYALFALLERHVIDWKDQ